jgi:hypothetical protein
MRTVLLDSNGNGCNPETFALPFSGAGYYMTIHGLDCTGVKLSDALDRISSFLDSHPQEIILLFLSGFVTRDGNPPNYQPSAAFETVLDQHLRRASDGASYIYDAETACKLAGQPWTPYAPGIYFPTAQYAGFCVLQGPTLQGVTSQGVPPQEVTPQQLYTTSARVILVETIGVMGTVSSDSARLTWSDGRNNQNGPIENERGYFAYTCTVAIVCPAGAADIPTLDDWLQYNTPDGNLGLFGTRPVGAGYESDPQILTLQANLTPGGAGPIFGLGFYAAFPPMEAAQAYNPTLACHLSSPFSDSWTTYSVNVVQVDNVEFGWNSKTSPCGNPAPIDNVVNDIVNFNYQTFGRVPFGFTGASQISVGNDGSVYKLGFARGSGSGALRQNYQLFNLTGSTGEITDWTPINFGGNRIAADPSGAVWVLDATGTHLTKRNANGTLSTIPLPPLGLNLQPSPLLDIAVANTGTLYAIANTSLPGTGVSRFIPIKYSNGQWEGLGVPAPNAPVVRIAANHVDIAVLDINGKNRISQPWRKIHSSKSAIYGNVGGGR